MSTTTIAESGVKERALPFTAAMVTAVLAGEKSQTRRIIQPQPHYSEEWKSWMWRQGRGTYDMNQQRRETTNTRTGETIVEEYEVPVDEWLATHRRCPFKVGGILYVTEHWSAPAELDGVKPRDIPDGTPIWYRAEPPPYGMKWGKFRVGRFMCRRMSRLRLEITGVRAQRLQEIDEEDAKAEGLLSWSKDGQLYKWAPFQVHAPSGERDPVWAWSGMPTSAREAYERLWCEIHGTDSWAASPFVWVVEFKRVPQ